MKVGAPTKYETKYCQMLIDHLTEGYLYESFAGLIDVHWDTLYEWEKVHPEFSEAKKKGLTKALLHDERLFKTGLLGTKIVKNKEGKSVNINISPALMIFRLKNRYPRYYRDKIIVEPENNQPVSNKPKSFEQFCVDACYPKPFEKQNEMRDFVFEGFDPRLLLGARRYGKTDYVTVLGVSYQIYLDPTDTNLIITKSEDRNKAIIREIAGALERNGVTLIIKNANNIRVVGCRGKDNNVSAVPLGTASLRGRHPNRVICDDIITPEDSSPATRKKAEAVYDELTKLTQNIIIIGQPVHFDDLYAKLRPLLTKKEYPYGSIPELDVNIEALELAGVSPESIRASYMLIVDAVGDLPLQGVNHIDEMPDGHTVAWIDPSFKGNDYTSLCIMRAYFDGVAVVGFCYKKAWNHCIDEMALKMKQFKVKKLFFETNSLGDMPIDLLREALPDIGIMGETTTVNKHQKIMNAGTYAHMIHLSKESNKIFIDQTVKYHYNCEHDDAPDSIASLLLKLGLIRGK